MKRLPLYEAEPSLGFERDYREFDPSCTRCKLHSTARTVCMQSEGYEGGLLVIGNYPSVLDDTTGRPFYDDKGRWLRALIDEKWNGPVAYDNALKCHPGSGRSATMITDTMVKRCAPYIGATVAHFKPKRILACGAHAAHAVMGYRMSPVSNRRAYSQTVDGVPVFILLDPQAYKNRFTREWLEDDLAWALTSSPPSPPFDAHYKLIETEQDALEAEAEMSEHGTCVYDVETVGFMHDPDWFWNIAIAAMPVEGKEPWLWSFEGLEQEEIREPLKRVLVARHIEKFGHNVKYDMLACRMDKRLGVTVGPIGGDTRLWRKMIFSEADGRLAALTNLVGMGGHKDEAGSALEAAIRGMRKLARNTDQPVLGNVFPPEQSRAINAFLRRGGDIKRYAYGMLDRDVLWRYNARDTLATARLVATLRPQLEEVDHVHNVWVDIVKPAVPALEQIEAWGMHISQEAVQSLSVYLNVKLTQSAMALKEHGLEDPASNPKVSEFLYKKLALNPRKKTGKGKASVDAASLEAMRDDHPAVAELLNWRKLEKLRGTYADGMQEHIGADSRVHPSLNLDGTRTGRLSSSQPNCQNIPRSGASREAKMAKNCFSAPDGRYLIQADYSQLELRFAAMLSGDKQMIDIFKSGDDYHLRCAKLISKTAWGVEPEEVLPGSEYRTRAKEFIFGLMYGMSDGGLAARMGCSRQEAVRIRSAVLGSFPDLAKWISSCIDTARKTGWTYTWWDGKKARRRSLYQVANEDGHSAERAAYNSPCQGTASDFCLASVTEVVNWILRESVDAKLVMTVHDSIILEVAESAVEECAWNLNRIMTQWNSMGVPLIVDQEIGKSWGDLVDLRYHALQATGIADSKYNVSEDAAPGVTAVYSRADKDAPRWLHRYEFDPVVVPKMDAVKWLESRKLISNITEPWKRAV